MRRTDRRQAATKLFGAARRERGFRLITIRTSRSTAVKKVISRSTEKPAISLFRTADTFACSTVTRA